MRFKFMKLRSILVRFCSCVLSLNLIFSNIISIFDKNTIEARADMSSVVGQLALGSPLLSEQFSVDDWNYWEMLAFGVFLSNFCVPFQDDYGSAFTSGSTQGSKGRGLQALKFSAGGDSDAEGYLRDMLNYCVSNQQNYKKIKVKYRYYEYDKNIGAASGERDATVADLFPQLEKTSSQTREVSPVSEIKRPRVGFYRIKGELSGLVSRYVINSTTTTNGAGLGFGDETVMDQAVLPDFYVDDVEVFSLAENWDVQMLKGLIAKSVLDGSSSNYAEAEGSFEKGADSDGAMSQLTSKELDDFISGNYGLFMDMFGNICVNRDNRNIIIIPAACNPHITTKKSYNYLNSLVINNLVVTNYGEDLAAFSIQPTYDLFTYLKNGSKAICSSIASWFGGTKTDFYIVGNSPATTLYTRLDSGRVLLCADTLALSTQDIYAYEKGNKSSSSSSSSNSSVAPATNTSFVPQVDTLDNTASSDVILLDKNGTDAHLNDSLGVNIPLPKDSINNEGVILVDADGYYLPSQEELDNKSQGLQNALDSAADALQNPNMPSSTNTPTNSGTSGATTNSGASGATTNSGTSGATTNSGASGATTTVDPSDPNASTVTGSGSGSALVDAANNSSVSTDFTYEHHTSDTNRSDYSGVFRYGYYIKQLVDAKSDEHQRLQLYVTDATTFIETSGAVSTDSTSAASAYGALSLIGTGFAPTTSNTSTTEDILNYFYNFTGYSKWDDAKVNLFQYSYYLTPTVDAANIESKYYLNYYMRMMTGQQGLTSYGFNNSVRQQMLNELEKADSSADVYNTLKTLKLASTEGGASKVNPVYLSFLAENTDNSIRADKEYTLNELSTLSEDFKPLLKKHFEVSRDWLWQDAFDKENEFRLSEINSYDTSPKFKSPIRVVKVYQPNDIFRDIADVYSLDSASNFELMTPLIYVTYLKFYGLIDGGKKSSGKFNEALFSNSSFKKFTSENFGSGLTKEERDEQSKLNVYRLLSLNKDGENYRTDLFESMFKSLFVKGLDKKLNAGSVGNVGSSGDLLSIHPIEETIFVGNIVVDHWQRFSLIAMTVLVLSTIISGALNARDTSYYIATVLSTVLMIALVPTYVNITPTVVARYVESTFGDAGTYWALVDSVNYSENQSMAAANGEEGTQDLQPILDILTFLDADNTMMLKLDISQKVISNSTLTYEDLQSLQSLRWLLPAMTQQILQSHEGQNFSFVSIPANTMYDNFIRLWIMYTGDTTVSPAGVGKGAYVDAYFSGIESYKNNWKGYTNLDEEIDSINSSPKTRAINRFRERSKLNFSPHKSFYIIDGMVLKDELDSNGRRKGKTLQEWLDFGKNVKNGSNYDYLDSGDFESVANDIKTSLNSYNKYQNPIEQSYGFLWTTENLGSYFYLIAKETFNGKLTSSTEKIAKIEKLVDEDELVDMDDIDDDDEDEDSSTTKLETKVSTGSAASVLMQLQGGVAERDSDVDGFTDEDYTLDRTSLESGELELDDLVRIGLMHMGTTGDIVDVCDMEEVFTNLMPYMYRVMVLAGGDGTSTGLLGDAKMTGHPYYSKNFLSWMFRSNWVAKLYEDRYYAGSGKVQDADGNSYTVGNMMDPYTYPEERPMVFSEAQMHQMGLRRENLNLVENKILDFNQEVVRRWTNLLNYSSLDGLEPENLYRQMGVDALFAFNTTFAKDNLIVTDNTLYPVQFDLRKISQITILRSMMTHLKQDATYGSGKLAEKLYVNGGMSDVIGLYFILGGWGLFRISREIGIILLFILGCITILLNWNHTAHDKFRALLGCILTSLSLCGLTMIYYYIIYIIVGKPVVDSMIDVEKIVKTPNRYSVLIWGGVILFISIAYAVIILIYFLNLLIWKRYGGRLGDGGFGVFENTLIQIRDTLGDITGSIGAKLGLSGIGDALRTLGPGATTEDAYSFDKNKAVPVYLANSQQQNGKTQGDTNSDIAGMESEGNYSSPVSAGENEKLTNEMNNAISEHQEAFQDGNVANISLGEEQSLQNGEYALQEAGADEGLSNEIDKAIESNKGE